MSDSKVISTGGRTGKNFFKVGGGGAGKGERKEKRMGGEVKVHQGVYC